VFLLNLSLGEFLGVLGALSGLVLGLYLLDRSRRRITVATLRFWQTAAAPTDARHRRRIQEPLSLILQLVGIALLVAALAQLRFGAPDRASRDHVLILDTSAWMAARGRVSTLMAEAQAQAIAYLRALPSSDRVLMVRADALATPATVFESNRKVLEDAVRESRPTSSALHLDRAVAFARQVQRLHARQPGEIVYAGVGRIAERDAGPMPRNLRVLQVTSPIENVGLKKIGLRRSSTDQDLWEVFVAVRNYGTASKTVPLMLTFGGAPAGSVRLRIAPGSEANANFEYRTRAAGLLEARLGVRDAIPDDDQVVLELPAQESLKVVVYTEEPELFRPLFAANPRVRAAFERPSAYSASAPFQVAVFDRFRPLQKPAMSSIWIEPPGEPARVSVRDTPLSRWNSDHPLGAGLKTRDARLESASVYSAKAGDIAIAEIEEGPVIVARASTPRSVLFGFHPLRSSMRYELTTPLLFANILRWMSPEIFRRWEVNAGTVGNITATLESDWDVSKLRVISQRNQDLPFSLRGSTLQFFSGMPGPVRVVAGERERVYSLTLPELAETQWEAPASARRGVPRALEREVSARDLWPFLALAGAAVLVFEWLRFGRNRRRILSAGAPPSLRFFRKAS
jgi:aerotolerance regulator-like protein